MPVMDNEYKYLHKYIFKNKSISYFIFHCKGQKPQLLKNNTDDPDISR